MSYDIIFGTTGVLNFAQGDFLMAGAMVGSGLAVGHRWPLVGALLVATAAGFLVGGLEERFAVRPATRHGHGVLGWVLSTLGVSIILEAAFGLVMGSDIRGVPAFVGQLPLHGLGQILVIPEQLLVIGSAVLMTVLLMAFYRFTWLGRALGAIEQDREGAQLRGIPVRPLGTLAFALGCAVAALAGFVAGPITTAYPTMGINFALYGFIAAALGGIPDVRGALVGGWLIGIGNAFIQYLVGTSFSNAVFFVVLLIALGLRPSGLLGMGVVREV